MFIRARMLLILLFSALCCFYTTAQVRTNFDNKKSIGSRGYFNKAYRHKPDFEIAAKNIEALIAKEKDKTDDRHGNKPFRIAEPTAIALDIAKSIDWLVDSGFAYGTFTIKANGALSTSANFDRFYLPQGTEMYIYNQNGRIITGPITENENNPNKIWGSWVYEGPFLTIEIKTPESTRNELLLHLSNIAYGYKKVYEQVGGFGQSNQQCEINVVCPLGTGWEAERNSVALCLSDNGEGTFSGALLMNTSLLPLVSRPTVSQNPISTKQIFHIFFGKRFHKAVVIGNKLFC